MSVLGMAAMGVAMPAEASMARERACHFMLTKPPAVSRDATCLVYSVLKIVLYCHEVHSLRGPLAALISHGFIRPGVRPLEMITHHPSVDL